MVVGDFWKRKREILELRIYLVQTSFTVFTCIIGILGKKGQNTVRRQLIRFARVQPGEVGKVGVLLAVVHRYGGVRLKLRRIGGDEDERRLG